MAHTFVTPTMVARDAAITLHDRLVTGSLVSRDVEPMFTASKIGQTVKVTAPGTFTAREFSGTTSADDSTENEVDVELAKHYYNRVDLTTAQKSFELSDLTRLVIVPIMDGIADAIDSFFIDQMVAGFARNVYGTDGGRPSSVAHIVGARKVLQDAKVRREGRVGLVDTTVEASFLQINQFTSGDYGQDGPPALREAMIARRFGLDWYTDANCGTFDRGDIAGTVLTDGVPVLAATTVHLDGFTAAVSTINKGTRFTVAGDTQIYTVTADITTAGNEADIPIYPGVSADLVIAGNDAAVTFKAAFTENLLYHPAAVAAAIVAPDPLSGGNSARQTYNNVSVRVSMDSSIVTLSDSLVIDVFTGINVVQPTGGVVFQA